MKLILIKKIVLILFLLSITNFLRGQSHDSMKIYGKCTVKFPYLKYNFNLNHSPNFNMYWNTYDQLDSVLKNSIAIVEVYNCKSEIMKDSLIGLKRAKSVISFISNNYGFKKEDFYINEEYIGKWRYCDSLAERISFTFYNCP